MVTYSFVDGGVGVGRCHGNSLQGFCERRQGEFCTAHCRQDELSVTNMRYTGSAYNEDVTGLR